MRGLFDRFRAAPKPDVLKEVHRAVKPSLLLGSYNGQRWRHKSMGITLDYITDSNKYKEMQRQATENLRHWDKYKIKPQFKVDVVPQDWGNAALEATKKYGVCYAVLNMANPQFPGGTVLEGGSAQEENMWHRSTCPRTLLEKGIYLDKEANVFLYDDETRNFLNAMKKMTAEELSILGLRRRITLSEAFKVFINPKPQICFRGPELLVNIDSSEISGRDTLVADSGLSFPLLPKNLIFPFFELRSAAPNLSDKSMDWKDRAVVEPYKIDLRRRIAAQLDTLILAETSSVILGAWGCGAFRNNPAVIAEIYREEIEKRAEFFQHIVFPVIDTSYRSENFSIFKGCLDGLKLGGQTNTLTRPFGEDVESKKKPNPHHSRFFSDSTDIKSEIQKETPETGPKSHQ